MPFSPPCCESEANSVSKKFRPGDRAEVFKWKQFSFRLPRSVTEISVSAAHAWPAFSYEHIEVFTKEIGMRRGSQ